MTDWHIAQQRSRILVVSLVVASALLLVGIWLSPYVIPRLHNPIPGALQIVVGTEQLAGAAAAPAVLLLDADALVATINGGGVNLTALVRDAEGKAVPGVTVHFSSAQGSVTPESAVTSAEGVATATFTAGNHEGQAVVTVEVNALTREAAIQIVKPNSDPTAHTLTLQPSTLVLKSGQEMNVTATLQDGTGQPLAGEVIALFGSMGVVSPASAVSDAAGRITFTYRAGSAAGQAMITVLAGYASASATLQIGTVNVPGVLDQQQFLPALNRQ